MSSECEGDAAGYPCCDHFLIMLFLIVRSGSYAVSECAEWVICCFRVCRVFIMLWLF